MCVVAINVTDVRNVVLHYAIVLSCNSPYNSCQLQKTDRPTDIATYRGAAAAKIAKYDYRLI